MSQSRDLLSVLRSSHQRLVGTVGSLTPEQVEGPSYCSEWSVAQVLAHLGSGAEIFGAFLSAGLAGEDPPGADAFPPVWDAWNAMTPGDQAANSLAADAAFLERLEALSDAELDGVHLSMFGMELGAPELMGMRLSELAVHSWDVAVSRDPSATIPADAAEPIVDRLGMMAGRTGKPGGRRVEVAVVTTEPAREMLLSVSDVVALVPAGTAAAEVALAETGPADTGLPGAELRLPAEALIRLVYGRLDPGHTPAAVSADGVDLEVLRTVFPGF